jgi:hypothetical protein
MTQTEAKEFVRKHFEEFINRKHLDIGKVNFAPEFEDHGADVSRPEHRRDLPCDSICGRGLQETS